MPTLIVPVSVAENPVSTGEQKPFGEGPWRSKIREVREKELPSTQDGQPFAGFATTDGEMLTIMLGPNEPMDGQEPVGQKPYFVDLVLRDGQITIDTVDIHEKDVPYWQIQQSTRLVANLALALGQFERVTGPDGSEAVAIHDGFIEALRSGQFDGSEIGFEIGHRKAKNGKTYDFVKGFFALV